MKNKYHLIILVFLGLAFVTLSCKALSNLVSKPEQPTPQEQFPTETLEPQVAQTQPVQEAAPTQPGEATSQPESTQPAETTTQPESTQPEPETTSQPGPIQPPSGGTQSPSAEFPLPPGATSLVNMAGTTNFQVKMSLNDVISFYREAFTKQGLKEDKLLTVTSDKTFSMVFNGSSNGESLVVQGVDLGNGNTNVNLRYEKM